MAIAASPAHAQTRAATVPAPGRPGAGREAREPRAGSAERGAIVEAVRGAVGNRTRYKIDHLRVAGRWAFFSGTEVVPLDETKGSELQETDLSVLALLERPPSGRWRVVERWTLPDDERAPRAAFIERLRARMRRDAIPASLFPPDLLP